MAITNVENSQDVIQATGGNIYVLDETRSYTLLLETTGILTIDGGDPINLRLDNPIVLGPGVGKIEVAESSTAVGFVVPRADSRM